MMNVAVPSDQNSSLKGFQKLSKYKDPKIEINEMCKLGTKIIPVVIVALGMIKKGTQYFIDQIPGKPSLQETQKIVLTSTDHRSPVTPKSPLNLKLNIYKERHITLHLSQVSD